jgi:RecB family exonuclease
MSYITEKLEQKGEPDSLNLTNTGLGPWSFTKLKVLQQCPLRFYLQYVVKIKPLETPPNLVTNVGKAVHRILELLIAGKTLTDSYRLTRKEFVNILTDDEWVAEVATTELNIMEFRKRLDDFEKKFPIKRYVQELRIGMTAKYEPTGFFGEDVYWRGVIDLGMQLEGDDVIIIDHKTGAPPEMGIRNFQNQLDVYKIMFHRGVQPVHGAQAGIHFVKGGKVLLDNYSTREEIEGKLTRELEFYIVGAIDRTKDLKYFKHFRGSHCKYCDYNEECKAGNLKDIESGTKRYFNIKEIK